MAAATAAGSLGCTQRCCRGHLLRDTAPAEASRVCVQTGARTHPRLPRDAQERPRGLRGARRPRGTSAASVTRGAGCRRGRGQHALGPRSPSTLGLLQKAAKMGSAHLMAPKSLRCRRAASLPATPRRTLRDGGAARLLSSHVSAGLQMRQGPVRFCLSVCL